MIEVTLEEGDRLDWALKAFKKKVLRSGLLKDLRRRRHYVKPSEARQLKADLTAREREIAALLIEGLTSKLIGKRLGVSPRTVDVYRARLMKKHKAATTPELVQKLLRA